MEIPLDSGDEVVTAVYHEGMIVVITKYGKVWYLEYDGRYFEVRAA